MLLGTFFQFSASDIASTTAYAGSLIGDFMPLLVVVIGITIGIFIIRAILSLR